MEIPSNSITVIQFRLKINEISTLLPRSSSALPLFICLEEQIGSIHSPGSRQFSRKQQRYSDDKQDLFSLSSSFPGTNEEETTTFIDRNCFSIHLQVGEEINIRCISQSKEAITGAVLKSRWKIVRHLV